MGSRVSGLGCLAVYTGAMAFHGPSYGLSRECAMKSQAKFSPERAKECVDWIEGDRGEAGDGGEGPGRLRDCPQGWSSSLPTHQRDLSGVSEEDQHNEGALQAEGEHRDVPQGLRRLRPQGARPLPGERLVRKQEPLYGGGQPLQPWWHDPEEWLGWPSAGGEAGDREQAPV